MEIREIQSTLNLHYGAAPRTPGFHVSELLRPVALSLGMWKKDDQDELDFTLAKYHAARGENIVQMYPTAIYRVAVGLAVEDWLGRQKPEINFHALGELAKDGIIGTPDGLEFDRDGGIIHEIKATWKSSRSDRESPMERLRKEWYWTAQACSYCYLASFGKELVRRAQLHIWWLNGNYQGSGPEYKTYEISYSSPEVGANWRLVEAKRDEALRGELVL